VEGTEIPPLCSQSRKTRELQETGRLCPKQARPECSIALGVTRRGCSELGLVVEGQKNAASGLAELVRREIERNFGPSRDRTCLVRTGSHVADWYKPLRDEAGTLKTLD
jgi:hypothetical protein